MTTPRPAARPPARPAIRIPRFTPQQKARISATLEALLGKLRRAFARMAALARHAADTLREAAAHMKDMARSLPAPHRDRPAWATPYGPAPRTSAWRHQ